MMRQLKRSRTCCSFTFPGKSCAHAPAMISGISNIVVGALAFELVGVHSALLLC